MLSASPRNGTPMPAQPIDFIDKWKAVELTERAAAQSHFNELCHLLGVKSPTDADHDGSWYCFERGATKTTGGEGWADVWKRECFGWEYKGKRKDLNAAFVQLQQYALALENPPLLVVCDLKLSKRKTRRSEAGRVAADQFARRELLSIDRKGAQDLVSEADGL